MFEAACPPEGKVQAHFWDSDLKGFGGIVGQTGIKTFVIQHGKLRVVGPEGEKSYPRFYIYISKKHYTLQADFTGSGQAPSSARRQVIVSPDPFEWKSARE